MIDRDITLDNRLDKAARLHREGYNCSQCVFMSFADVHGLGDDVAAATACGLGGGVGGQHQVCGAVSAMALVAGTLRYGSPADKGEVYRIVAELSEEFARGNGSIVCGELLAARSRRKPCSEYIADAVRLLDDYLSRR